MGTSTVHRLSFPIDWGFSAEAVLEGRGAATGARVGLTRRRPVAMRGEASRLKT
jgi:hypothetical protein